MFRRFLSFQAAFALVLCVFTAAAQAEAGRVEVLLGTATVTRGAATLGLAQGALVEQGDAIETGSSSSVQLRMTSGEQIYLRSGTRFVIESYAAPTTRQDPGRSFYSLVRGGLRAITNAVVRRDLDSYRINTAVATIGIRGTILTAEMATSLTVGVEEGAVSVSNPAGALEVPAGKGAFVADANTAPRLLDSLPAFGEEAAAAGGAAGTKAAGSASGGISTPVGVTAGILAAVGVVVAASGGDEASTTTTTTPPSTGN